MSVFYSLCFILFHDSWWKICLDNLNWKSQVFVCKYISETECLDSLTINLANWISRHFIETRLDNSIENKISNNSDRFFISQPFWSWGKFWNYGVICSEHMILRHILTIYQIFWLLIQNGVKTLKLDENETFFRNAKLG